MASPFDRFTGADAGKFVDPKNWGEVITYTPDGAAPESVNASVSDVFTFESPNGVGISNAELMVLVKSSDMANLAYIDTFQRTGDPATYYPIHWEPDGFGHTLIYLSKTQLS